MTIESCDAASSRAPSSRRAGAPAETSSSTSRRRRTSEVAADPDKVRQVLVNLVENAIKYSPDGGRVEVRLEDGGHGVRFSVSDAGLGTLRAEHARIFEKFYRLDPNLTRGVGGTGLGLYICRELVRRMDGRIWVDSAEAAARRSPSSCRSPPRGARLRRPERGRGGPAQRAESGERDDEEGGPRGEPGGFAP